MQQRVHAADIDKGAEIGQAAHGAGHGVAFLDLAVALFLGLALLVLEHGAAVHHHVFVGDIQLDDAAADLLANQLLQIGGSARTGARGGHEGAHAHVHADAALDHGGDHAGDGRLIGEGLFERRPIARPLDLHARQFVVALGIATLDGNRILSPA